jgi:iron(III) transport system substrate-binding protein
MPGQLATTIRLTAAVIIYWLSTFPLLSSMAWGRDVAEVLRELKGLRGAAREARLVEGAKREGKVVLYGTTGIDDMKVVFDAFKQRYRFLEVSHFRSGAVKVYNRVVTEARAGRYEADVVEATSLTAFQLRQDNLLESYLSPSRDGLMRNAMDKDGYWTAWFQQVIALAYNKKLIKADEVPRSYEDLLDPKWRGKMSIDHEDQEPFGTLLDYWGEEKGMAYFKRLAQNKPTLQRGHNLQTNLLSAGETHLAPWLFAYRPLAMRQKGAPVDIALLKPVMADPKYVMLAKNNPRPYGAILLIDWLLSDGQKIVVEKFGRTGTRPGLNERFPEVVLPEYLVATPERQGPNVQSHPRLFCSTFGTC